MKKVLLVSLSTGSGHVRAANALQETAKKHFSSNIATTHIDLKDFITLPVKTALIDSYDLLIKQAPDIWGFLYNKTNTPLISKQLKKITKSLEKINTSKFISYIEQIKPDYILFTHFLPADIYSSHKKNSNLPPFGVLVTDYGLHELWISEGAQDYFVATQKMAEVLKRHKIKTKNIHVSGIPVDPVFYKKQNKLKIRKTLNINTSKKPILVLSGGNGLTDLSIIINSLCESNKKLHIFAITGKNKKLKNKLQKIKTPKNISLEVLGWVDNINDYITACDIVIGKCGGMTTSECMTAKTPIIAIDPIPGQEEQNAQFILENKLGYIAKTKEDILYYLHQPDIKITKKVIKSADNILKIISK